MSIDMKNFSGATEDPAAVGQQIANNTYQTETQFETVDVDQGILNAVREDNQQVEPVVAQPEPVKQEPSQQELNFKALREEVDRIKAERDEFRQNLDLLRANAQQNQPVRQESKFLDGLADNDIPNVQEIRQAFAQREQQYQAQLEELTVQQSHPDYVEVLEKYTAPLLKQKPHLAEGIAGARNKALFAYELGKMAQAQFQNQPVQPQATQPSVQAQKIVENAQKPRNFGQVGGQGALSQADFYASMSDNDFMKMASKNLGEI